VKFRLPISAVVFLQTGIAATWQPLLDIKPLSQPNVFGSDGAFFTGISRANESFILTAAPYPEIKNDRFFAGLTFASSYELNDYYDECNGQRDTQSKLMLLYR
jgi:hypothetical protein